VRPHVVSHLNAKTTQLALGGIDLFQEKSREFKHICPSLNFLHSSRRVSQFSATNRSLFSKSPKFVQRDIGDESWNLEGFGFDQAVKRRYFA
jgi:hypothetical protein